MLTAAALARPAAGGLQEPVLAQVYSLRLPLAQRLPSSRFLLEPEPLARLPSTGRAAARMQQAPQQDLPLHLAEEMMQPMSAAAPCKRARRDSGPAAQPTALQLPLWELLPQGAGLGAEHLAAVQATWPQQLWLGPGPRPGPAREHLLLSRQLQPGLRA